MTDLNKFLAECRERLEKSTPGPWWLGYWARQCKIHHKDKDGKYTPFHHGRPECKYEYSRVTDSEHFKDTVSSPEENVQLFNHAGRNAELIANAPSDLKLLLEVVERQSVALDEAHTVAMLGTNHNSIQLSRTIGKLYSDIDALIKKHRVVCND